jgi:hypothetical protein
MHGSRSSGQAKSGGWTAVAASENEVRRWRQVNFFLAIDHRAPRARGPETALATGAAGKLVNSEVVCG